MKQNIKNTDPLHYKANLLAKEVGDSLYKFIDVVYREITSVKFKGYEPVRVEINFSISHTHTSFVTISISTSRDVTSIGIANKIIESRCYNLVLSQLESLFWLVLTWLEDLYTNHQKLLKSIPLFNQQT